MNPTAVKKGLDKSTPGIDAAIVDPATALQEYLDVAGAVRFCDIGPTKYGRGLVARRDMQPGETVMRIPLSETILVEHSNSGKMPDISDIWAGKLAQKLVERQKQAETTLHFTHEHDEATSLSRNTVIDSSIVTIFVVIDQDFVNS